MVMKLYHLVIKCNYYIDPSDDSDFLEHSEHIGGTVTFIVFEQQPTLQFILSNIVTIPFINFLISANIIIML
jgi:hypothetical protein